MGVIRFDRLFSSLLYISDQTSKFHTSISRKEYDDMTLALFLLWILLCSPTTLGAGTVQILIIGAIVTALIRLFMYKAMRLGLREELLFFPRVGYILLYVLLLIWEVLKANFAVLRILLGKPDSIRPAIVRVRIPLKDDLSRTLMSCAITLTPGTITVDVDHDKRDLYTVHCLDASMGEGLESSGFVRILTRLDRLAEKHPPKAKPSQNSEVSSKGGNRT